MRPLNDMPEIQRPYANYTVVGAGKTGMDACIWLLQNGVTPARIRWIMPRDAWMLDRASFQPGAENFERSIGSIIGQFEAITEATSSLICSSGSKSAGYSSASTSRLSLRCTDALLCPRRNWSSCAALKTSCALGVCVRRSGQRSF